jgi:DNA-binding beta-propeller fold protein YncE
MWKLKRNAIIILLLIKGLTACKQHHDGNTIGFANTPQEHPVSDVKLNEASGMADSKANPGYLWVEQDSGNPPDLTLLQHNGTVLKSIHLANAVNRDWEDMVLAAGPVPGKQYLYIAETGDNLLVYDDYAIYRLEEPTATTDTVQGVDRIPFFYPDGSHNAEAILVDPDTKDIYIITKTDLHSKLFKLAYTNSTKGMNKVEEVGALPYNYVVSAALSPDGKEILVKTYDAIYHYQRSAGETIVQTLSKKYISLPYQQEPQGEAIVFDNNDSGYYTLSEKALASSVKLYFYKRTK